MTKQIEDYTADELSAKIEAIKAERERTANALKKYEEELERRKHEVPLGVPLKDKLVHALKSYYMFDFASDESRAVFNVRLNNYVEALQKLAEGEPIDVAVLLPLLKKGWVAMDKNGDWLWFKNKPHADSQMMCWRAVDIKFLRIREFNLKPATDWKDSLMECGL